MQILLAILIGVLLLSPLSTASKCRSCAQIKNELPVEELRLLRYEFIKNQILKKLHLMEPPRTTLPKPPLKSLLIIAEMAENKTVQEIEEPLKTESVVIYPKESNQTCINPQDKPCKHFEFTLSESLILDNFVSAEVWFYQQNLSESMQVNQIITDPFLGDLKNFELNNQTMEKNHVNWIKYVVPHCSFLVNFTKDNVLTLEVVLERNETDFESMVEEGDEKPFLIIRSNIPDVSSRRKRGITCSSGSTSCCKESFFLNFSEIGWDNWILHPDGYEANFCRGRCFNDLSNTRFYHSAVLLSYIRDNKDIAEDIGLNMCCTPSVMAPVTIIYRDEEGLIYHKSIENMRVEACDCA